MSDKGKGWYGESERHSKAAKKASAGRVRSAMRMVRSGIGRTLGLAGKTLMLPLTALGYLGNQASGTRRNLGRAWDYLTFDNLLPPSVVDLGQWAIETTPKVFGVRDTTPWQQVGAAVTVALVALLATVLSGGLLIGVLIVVGLFAVAGVVRHVPAVNQKWNAVTGVLPIKNDYDVPRWRRD